MATIGVIWFTYKPDGEMLLESMRAAHRTIEASGHLPGFYIYDDGMYPISKAVRTTAETKYGAVYVKTFYPRGGNLLGPENLKGQTAAMATVGNFCDVLIKCDSDTLILKTDWVEELLEADCPAVMVGSFKGLKNYPMGNCYAVHTQEGKLLRNLAKDVEKYPAWTGCFEDYEVGTRIHRLCDGDEDYVIRWRSGTEDGFWLCDPQQVSNRAKDARVVSCGYGWTSCPEDKRKEYKALQLVTMRMLNDDVEGKLVLPEKKNEETNEETNHGTT